MNSANKLANTLSKCIVDSVIHLNKRLDNNDKSPTGTIIEVLTNNNYRVQIQGSYYTLSDTNSHNVGDSVEIFIPNNDWSKIRISNK